MLITRKSLFLIIIIAAVAPIACSSLGSRKISEKLETEIKPSARFEEARIKSVSVLKFDAKYVKSVGGEIIDYIELSNKFTDGMLKRFYEIGRIDVALGEYEDRIIETDTLEKKRGDLEIQGSSLKRSIEFKATPYKKIETILNGRVNKFQEGDGETEKEEWGNSYIDITLKLTDTYTGSVYWITDMSGKIKDVTETITQSISKGKYTEPLTIKKEEPRIKIEKKKEKPKKEEKSR